jgi:hypothetical protein
MSRPLNLLVPEMYWSGSDLGEFYDTDWPLDWVLKPISGSGFAAFGKGGVKPSELDISYIMSWDAARIHAVYAEWAYGRSSGGYLMEERIPTMNGQSPHGLRFFAFDGQVQLIQIDFPRIKDIERRFYLRH